MAERIGELETEKHYLDASYEQVCFQSSVQDVTVETLTERFNEAKAMLKTGELSTTKSLIELFINKVNVYLDYIEIIFNFHPDLVPPDTFDSHKEDYESSIEESPSNSYSDTILDNKKVSTLVGGYCGGGGSCFPPSTHENNEHLLRLMELVTATESRDEINKYISKPEMIFTYLLHLKNQVYIGR